MDTQLLVADLMTIDPVVDEAARVMVDRRIHRLVATDDAGHPVGVLSAIDFVALYANA